MLVLILAPMCTTSREISAPHIPEEDHFVGTSTGLRKVGGSYMTCGS